MASKLRALAADIIDVVRSAPFSNMPGTDLAMNRAHAEKEAARKASRWMEGYDLDRHLAIAHNAERGHIPERMECRRVDDEEHRHGITTRTGFVACSRVPGIQAWNLFVRAREWTSEAFAEAPKIAARRRRNKWLTA